MQWVAAQANDTASPLYGVADPQRLATSGHSRGGKLASLVFTSACGAQSGAPPLHQKNSTLTTITLVALHSYEWQRVRCSTCLRKPCCCRHLPHRTLRLQPTLSWCLPPTWWTLWTCRASHPSRLTTPQVGQCAGMEYAAGMAKAKLPLASLADVDARPTQPTHPLPAPLACSRTCAAGERAGNRHGRCWHHRQLQPC